MKRRITVRGICIHDNKLLCARQKAYKDGTPNDYWCVPGGGTDENETLTDALEREMVEETGVKPIIGNLLYIQQYHKYKTIEYLEFFFHIKNAKDYLRVDLSKTTHGVEEIEMFDFIDPRTNHVLPKFLTTESLDNLDTQPAKIFNYL